MERASYEEYREALLDLVHSINHQIPMEEKDWILILYHLNTIDRIMDFNEWVKSKLKGDVLEATPVEITRAAVHAAKRHNPMQNDYDGLHKKSSCHKDALLKASKCGCFYCLKIFEPTEIEEWIMDNGGYTAICPYCGIDAILPEVVTGEYELNKPLLESMYEEWFGEGDK